MNTMLVSDALILVIVVVLLLLVPLFVVLILALLYPENVRKSLSRINRAAKSKTDEPTIEEENMVETDNDSNEKNENSLSNPESIDDPKTTSNDEAEEDKEGTASDSNGVREEEQKESEDSRFIDFDKLGYTIVDQRGNPFTGVCKVVRKEQNESTSLPENGKKEATPDNSSLAKEQETRNSERPPVEHIDGRSNSPLSGRGIRVARSSSGQVPAFLNNRHSKLDPRNSVEDEISRSERAARPDRFQDEFYRNIQSKQHLPGTLPKGPAHNYEEPYGKVENDNESEHDISTDKYASLPSILSALTYFGATNSLGYDVGSEIIDGILSGRLDKYFPTDMIDSLKSIAGCSMIAKFMDMDKKDFRNVHIESSDREDWIQA